MQQQPGAGAPKAEGARWMWEEAGSERAGILTDKGVSCWVFWGGGPERPGLAEGAGVRSTQTQAPPDAAPTGHEVPSLKN